MKRTSLFHSFRFSKFVGILSAVFCVVTLSAQVIPGRYIAVLKDNVPDVPAAAQGLAAQHRLQVGYIYKHALRGFAFAGAPQAAAALARQGEVLWVEADQEYHANAEVVPTGIARANVPSTLQNGLGPQTDVDIAIIDTGIQSNHPDLNVAGGIHFFTQGWRLRSDNNWSDGNGHGTHVAGTAAARNQGSGVAGVAPGARLWAVKVLNDNGSGSTAAVIAGIDWVAQNSETVAVANMSLGGGFSQAINDAVKKAVNAGVVMVVAAGNESANAATKSPASEPTAITVSALADSDGLPGGNGTGTSYGPDDTLASFSNFGSLVDICAPGVGIYSTYINSSYASLSGTSMASPHVAGAAALYIATYGFTKDAAGVQVVGNALKSKGWHAGDTQYILGGDGDGFQEPLLNVGALFSTPANDPPLITSMTENASGTEDVAISFSASATGGNGDPLTYTWNFGDGSSATGPSVSHTFLWGGTFPINLTVTDGKGGSDSKSSTATVTEVNDIPVANPGGPYSGEVGQAVTFNGNGSTDFDNQDGTPSNNQTLSYNWTFGDDGTGTGAAPQHKYAAAATFTVTVTVSDGIASNAKSTTATISSAPPPPSGVVLSAYGYKVKGVQYVDLTWTGASSGSSVEIYQDGTKIATVNGSSYTHNLNQKGNGTYTFRVNDTVKNVWSNEVTVSF